jgi:predicted dehydrogenase
MSHPQTTLVGLVDTDQETLDRACVLFPAVDIYTSFEMCIQTHSPDIAIVATPPSTHREIIEQLVRNHISMIVCEKPITHSLDDARLLLNIVQDSTCVVNYQRRFFPLIQSVRERIEKQSLGKIQTITGRYSNGLYNNGGHLINTIQYMLGENMSVVSAQRDTINTNHPVGDFNATVLFRSQSSIPIVLQSFDQRCYGMNDIDIYCEKGMIGICNFGYEIRETSIEPSLFAGVSQLAYEHARVQTDIRSMVADSLQHCIEVYEGKTTNRNSIASALETLEILDAVKSAL